MLCETCNGHGFMVICMKDGCRGECIQQGERGIVCLACRGSGEFDDEPVAARVRDLEEVEQAARAFVESHAVVLSTLRELGNCGAFDEALSQQSRRLQELATALRLADTPN